MTTPSVNRPPQLPYPAQHPKRPEGAKLSRVITPEIWATMEPAARGKFDAAETMRSTSGCLEWLGSKDRHGYGQISIWWITFSAHRIAWILRHGPITNGLHILHKCGNKVCVDTDHMRLGTVAENNMDQVVQGRHFYAMKTHCPQGHPLSGDNLCQDEKKRNHRSCRACRLARKRSAYYRSKP